MRINQSLQPCIANYDPAGMHARANVGQQSVLTAGQQNGNDQQPLR
jgi:hypothetical protein